VDVEVGDADRVEGALTAMESAVEAVVDRDVVDPAPVRKIEAASRGRPAAEVVAVLLLGAPLELALILILAASWFREGKRLPPDLCGCGASTRPAAADGVVAIVVVVNKKVKAADRCREVSRSYFYSCQLLSIIRIGSSNISDQLLSS
jgi:hypothetical protein